MGDITARTIMAELDRVTPNGRKDNGNPQNMRPRQIGEVTDVEERPVAGDLLFNRRVTPKGAEARKFESIQQRNAAAYLATGRFSFKQVAELVGVVPTTISHWMHNAWFQETVVTLGRELVGADAIMAQFKAEAMSSLLVLVEIRDDKKAPASARKSSCDSILDRAMGKPVQRMETDNVVRSANPAEEVAELQRANELLRGRAGIVKECEARPDEPEGRPSTRMPDVENTLCSIPQRFPAAD